MKLAALFCNHAVLQRNISVPVWGWMKPLSKVQVTLGEYTAESLSGADGKFMLRLPPMPAGGPYKLTATELDTGEKVECEDVWVGEVWLASGQSNMQWTLEMIGDVSKEEIANSDKPQLRMLKVPNKAFAGQQSDIEAEWHVASPKTTPDFSAVAYHFAKKLQNELGITVGVINSSWGGTIIEAWTSREMLMTNPEMTARVASYESVVNSPEFWAQYEGADLSDPATGRSTTANDYPTDPGITEEAKEWSKLGFDDSSWESMKKPSSWKMHDIESNGVIWFRKTISVPAEWVGKELELGIGAVDKQDITFFNGECVGQTGEGLEEQYWNQNRVYTVPANLVKEGQNVVTVRANSFVHGGGLIGPDSSMNIAPKDDESAEAISLAGNWQYKMEHDYGVVAPGGITPGPGCPNTPYMLYDNMIAPLVPYAIRGAIWYQGESNADKAHQYRRLMTDMIKNWRHIWGQGNFPFLMVQLANYMPPADFAKDEDWPYLREAQLQSLSEPETGMATIIDIGEEMDIHPRNKKDVGLRLAAWALNKTYGQNVIPSGPLYRSMAIEGDKIRIAFDYTAEELIAKGDELKTFVIAGEDKSFKPATAIIEGTTVVVSNPDIKNPVAVRYAWANNPENCNLYNSAGLPASPFRTDMW